jgi:amino acid adenylation domain-containing protein
MAAGVSGNSVDDYAIELLDGEAVEHSLSPGQRAMWFLHCLSPTSAAYTIANAVRITSGVDVGALHRTFKKLTGRHCGLRTTFREVNGEPVARVSEPGEPDFELYDASGFGECELRDRLAEESRRPFDLGAGPLVRVRLFSLTGGGHILLLCVHHIVADFWSLAVIAREMAAIYSAEIRKEEAVIDPIAPRMSDYLARQRRMLASPTGDHLWKYWQEQLAGNVSILNLPTDRPRPPVQTYCGAQEPLDLSMELTGRLKGLGKSHGVTLFVLLLAAFAALIHRYTSQEDFLLGCPTAGRHRSGLTGLVGYLVNPVVIRSRPEGNKSFADFLVGVRETALAALAHREFPFPLLVEKLQPARDPSRSPIFQVMFVYLKAIFPGQQSLTALALQRAEVQMDLGELAIDSVPLKEEIAQFDLTFSLAEFNGRIIGNIQYNTDIFDSQTVGRMTSHFERVLQSISVHPERRLCELVLLRDQERHQLITEWNETEVRYHGVPLIHRLFEEQVDKAPERVVLVVEYQSLTYRELNRRANQLGRHLRDLGMRTEAKVGIMTERSAEMVIGLLGILKAGGAYVPLDPADPKGRVAFILRDVGIEFLLTQAELADRVPGYDGKLITIPNGLGFVDQPGEDNLAAELSPNHLAYIIYTSGSTGLPKGAMNTNQGIGNRLLWMQDTYGLTEEDRVLQKTPYSFDVSVWELFWPLTTGSCLVMARPEGHRDPSYVVRAIVEHEITTVHFVPSMLKAFLSDPRVQECRTLRRSICSGEELSSDQPRAFFSHLDCELHNLYGPTEAAIDVTYWACRPSETQPGLKPRREPQSVPIGRPIANSQVYILDGNLEPAPMGVAGELYLGGAGLAHGYVGRGDLTADKFMPNPICDEPGKRIYRSGDLGRRLSDGNIEFLGRRDQQVKIRGYRLELGEIEAVLKQVNGISDAAVLTRGEENAEKRLVAYVIGGREGQRGSRWLREELQERLPGYMVPSAYVWIPEMPLTSNGKVDRRGLTAWQEERDRSEEEYAGPRSEAEEVTAEIFGEVLGRSRVGIRENFFELGGHSLLVVQAVARMREQFGVEVPIPVFFKKPTIESLALFVTQSQAEQDPERIASLLDSLESLSMEEVNRLLEGEALSPDDCHSGASKDISTVQCWWRLI